MSDNVDNWLNDFYNLNPDALKPAEHVKAAKKESTLTLAMELPAMDFKDRDFYNNLSEEHKKEISLWVLMRYMSSSQNSAEQHLTFVNDVVNVNFSALSKHPELQWKLLTICGTNKKQFHPWIPPGKRAKKNKLEEALIQFFPLMKDEDLEMMQTINTQQDFEQFFKDNAFDDKTIKEIFKGDTKGKQ